LLVACYESPNDSVSSSWIQSLHRSLHQTCVKLSCFVGLGIFALTAFETTCAHVQGWWSYEVCCLSHINQFHAEHNHLQAAHSLGQYPQKFYAPAAASICHHELLINDQSIRLCEPHFQQTAPKPMHALLCLS